MTEYAMPAEPMEFGHHLITANGSVFVRFTNQFAYAPWGRCYTPGLSHTHEKPERMGVAWIAWTEMVTQHGPLKDYDVPPAPVDLVSEVARLTAELKSMTMSRDRFKTTAEAVERRLMKTRDAANALRARAYIAEEKVYQIRKAILDGGIHEPVKHSLIDILDGDK